MIWVNVNQPGSIRPSQLAVSIPITPSHVTSCEKFAGMVPDLLSREWGKELLRMQGDSCRTEMCCRLHFTTDGVKAGE